MNKQMPQIIEEIQRTPPLVRLEMAQTMIRKMCGELRPPQMSIPPESTDEDLFISVTLQDAVKAIEANQ